MAVFPVCDVLQGGSPVSGPVDDRPLFGEEHFLFLHLCLCACSPPDPYRLQACYVYRAQHTSAPCILRDRTYSHMGLHMLLLVL